MKKILIFSLLLTSVVGFSQAFKGKGDQKLNVGMNIQDGGTGIVAGYDYGVGQNLSIGLQSTYAIGIRNSYDGANFARRFDVRARANANIGDVLNFSDDLDVYLGLNIGMHNFGGQIGARYFFTDGFGVNVEMVNPIARFDSDVYGYRHLNNQTQLNVGISFNF
ncbi:hypothetical protein K5I29_11290 [Flavobacterium agricola]|uniref:Outer membrane protein beta-barrel domain-containing protein n=1 Tax=Flavobacterium agricola TaxID=2870839 RepID=A0ABY6LXJ9_9FLAO|nr:DUF6646 family protein [Flavobacterium agricola]UYW01057.1 hypothetical protein K5I29_11290 [Flavobacterium agricola]